MLNVIMPHTVQYLTNDTVRLFSSGDIVNFRKAGSNNIASCTVSIVANLKLETGLSEIV